MSDPLSASEIRERATQLVEQWRSSASVSSIRSKSLALMDCADELEAALLASRERRNDGKEMEAASVNPQGTQDVSGEHAEMAEETQAALRCDRSLDENHSRGLEDHRPVVASQERRQETAPGNQSSEE
jgi:hypothetical protein